MKEDIILAIMGEMSEHYGDVDLYNRAHAKAEKVYSGFVNELARRAVNLWEGRKFDD